MALTIRQITILANSPLRGSYGYKDLFQFLPPKKQNELFQHDHPLVLEIQFEKEIYPKRSNALWHRDIWEEERFEYIKKRSPRKRMNPEDPWVQAYQEQTRQLRYAAILKEVCNLLTLFTHYRFFTYEPRQSWFIPIQADKKTGYFDESVWGQLGFKSNHGGPVEAFTKTTCDYVPIVPTNQYYRRFRDTRYFTEEDQIDLPDNIDLLLDIYFSLPPIKKTAYYMGCHLYNQALFFQNTIPSLSMVASVMAIEKVMNHETEAITTCKECGAPESIEKCTKCNTPIYRLRSRFREFMATYYLPDEDRLYKEMYDTRSRLAHGGLLREDLFDTGFYAGDKDNEARLRRNSLIAVHDALLHWLMKCEYTAQ